MQATTTTGTPIYMSGGIKKKAKMGTGSGPASTWDTPLYIGEHIGLLRFELADGDSSGTLRCA